MVKKGEANIIKKIGGKEDTKKFLGNIGFVVGAADVFMFFQLYRGRITHQN